MAPSRTRTNTSLTHLTAAQLEDFCLQFNSARRTLICPNDKCKTQGHLSQNPTTRSTAASTPTYRCTRCSKQFSLGQIRTLMTNLHGPSSNTTAPGTSTNMDPQL